MGNRQAKPTPADLDAARKLRAEWDALARTKGLTQDRMAVLMGGTQGLVSQYLNGRIPLNYLALRAFSGALGIDPTTVRTDLPEQQLSGLVSSPGHSHLARLDLRNVRITGKVLKVILARRDAVLDLSQAEDAELFAETYAAAVALPDADDTELTLGAVVADLLAKREAVKVGRRDEGEQVGGADRGKAPKARTG